MRVIHVCVSVLNRIASYDEKNYLIVMIYCTNQLVRVRSLYYSTTVCNEFDKK